MGVSAGSFFGGIHPADGKDKLLSREGAIIPYVPKKVRVSMKQGLGPACKCSMKVGAKVTQGRKISKSLHDLSASVHAPVTGVVTAVTDDYCEIEVESCDLLFPDDPHYQAIQENVSFSNEEIVKKMKEGGIVGMGGAGFPCALKYAATAPIHTVIINGAECEPYLTCDEHLMNEMGYAVLNGALLMKKAVGASRLIFCLENNKKAVLDHLRSLAGGFEYEMDFCLLPTKYPQGGERQLIQTVTKKQLPAGKLPAAVGVIISNVHTARAVADMVFADRPSISRVITVTGLVKNPSNFLVPIGTDLGELVQQAGGVTERKNRVIVGGPMTGVCIGENMGAKTITRKGNDTVTKVSGGLLILEPLHKKETPCIRCGACATVCPARLVPYKIDFAIRREDVDTCQALHATECIACGCCSYICPAKRELSYYTAQARDSVRAKLREEAKKRG